MSSNQLRPIVSILPSWGAACLRQAGMPRPYNSFCEQRFPAGPGFGPGFAVAFAGVWGFAGAHEAVTGTFIGHRLESFAGGLHVLNCSRKSGADARIVSRVEAYTGALIRAIASLSGGGP